MRGTMMDEYKGFPYCNDATGPAVKAKVVVGQLLALVAVESKDLLLKSFLLGANANLSRKEEPWLARLCFARFPLQTHH